MSGSPGLSGSARPVTAAQKSAEGIVAGLPAKARTTDRVSRTVRSCGPSGRISSWSWPWSRRRRVKPGAPEPEGPKDRSPHGACRTRTPGGWAATVDGGGRRAWQPEEGAGACPAQQGGARRRWHDRRRVGRSPEGPLARDQVPTPRWQLHAAAGTAGRDTEASGGVRLLGVPTVLDRFIQQAVMQVLQEDWDPGFSDASYGFRPGRSAHQAVRRAQEHILAGFDFVVDLDLEKFFDRVNHDILMGLVAKRVADKPWTRSWRRAATVLSATPTTVRHEGAEGRPRWPPSCSHAARGMRVGPSEPPGRGRLQTAVRCFGQEPGW